MKKKVFIPIIVLLIIGLVIYLLSKDTDKTNKGNNNSNGEEHVVDEKRDGKELTIYKFEYKYYPKKIYYDVTNNISDEEKDSYDIKEVGKIVCKSKDCVYENAGNNYVLVEEEGSYSLYNYTNNHLVTDLFAKNKVEDSSVDLLLDGDLDVHGIKYSKSTTVDIYNIKNNKTITIKGSEISLPGYNTDILNYKSLIAVTNEDYNVTTIYNYISGDKIIEYNDMFDNIVGNKDDVFILFTNDKKEKEIYNSNGKKIIDNYDNIKDIVVFDNTLVVNTDTQYICFKTSNLDKIFESKKYTSVIMTGSNFALVTVNNDLKLVDLKDNELTTFITDFNRKDYIVHSKLSGWFIDNDKEGLYFVIETNKVTLKEVMDNNKDMDEESLIGYDLGYEYYYIPKTKETGKIPTYIGGYAKPVLYLYPKEETNVTITFDNPNSLTTTYPKYINNWKVKAFPNGDLYDKDGRYYYGLYWEENKNHNVSFDEGFYVTKENALKFLEEKLDYIGLTQREANEFIMYWLPILEKNDKSLVYFELTNERNNYSKINITPKPDSMLRIAMHVKKVKTKANIEEQKLTKFNRTGFSVVEWGGQIH